MIALSADAAPVDAAPAEAVTAEEAVEAATAEETTAETTAGATAEETTAEAPAARLPPVASLEREAPATSEEEGERDDVVTRGARARAERKEARARARTERKEALARASVVAIADDTVRARVDRLLKWVENAAVIATAESDVEGLDPEHFMLSGPFACAGCGACRQRWFVCQECKGVGSWQRKEKKNARGSVIARQKCLPQVVALQSDGVVDTDAVVAFGAAAVYAYLDAFLERTLRANLRLETVGERVAQVRLCLEHQPTYDAAAAKILAEDAADDRLARGDALFVDCNPWSNLEAFGDDGGRGPQPTHALIVSLNAYRSMRNARTTLFASQPGELWGAAAAFGGVAAVAHLRQCCTRLRAEVDVVAPPIFREAALKRFPVLGLLLAGAQAAPPDFEALYKRMSSVIKRPRVPGRVAPKVTWDDFVFTVEVLGPGGDCLHCAEAKFKRQTFGTFLYTPRVPSTPDGFLQFDDDDDFDALDDLTLRVFCMERASGCAALLFSSGSVTDVDDAMIFFDFETISVKTLIPGFAPYDEEPADMPAVQLVYEIDTRVFSINFMTVSSYDIDDMEPNDVLNLLEHFVDFDTQIASPA